MRGLIGLETYTCSVRCQLTAMEDLAHTSDARGPDEVWPKALSNMFDGVYSQCVYLERLDQTSYPLVKGLYDLWILSVEIGHHFREPA